MTSTVEVPKEIALRYASWSRICIRLSVLQYTVGVIGVACGALAAAMGGEYARYLAAASGVSTAILGFVRPEQRYLRFIAAWRTLDVAILKFRLQQPDVSALITAVEQGEALLTEPVARVRSPEAAEAKRQSS